MVEWFFHGRGIECAKSKSSQEGCSSVSGRAGNCTGTHCAACESVRGVCASALDYQATLATCLQGCSFLGDVRTGPIGSDPLRRSQSVLKLPCRHLCDGYLTTVHSSQEYERFVCTCTFPLPCRSLSICHYACKVSVLIWCLWYTWLMCFILNGSLSAMKQDMSHLPYFIQRTSSKINLFNSSPDVFELPNKRKSFVSDDLRWMHMLLEFIQARVWLSRAEEPKSKIHST
jgi:hypothetical protein